MGSSLKHPCAERKDEKEHGMNEDMIDGNRDGATLDAVKQFYSLSALVCMK